jgi:hypothetical protein
MLLPTAEMAKLETSGFFPQKKLLSLVLVTVGGVWIGN